MRRIGDFVETTRAERGRQDLAKAARIGMIGHAGDRRDDDMRELGPSRRSTSTSSSSARTTAARAASAARPRPRRRGRPVAMAEGAALQAGRGRPRRDRRGQPRHGPQQPGRPRRHVRRQARPGRRPELENRTHSAQAGAHSSELVGDPDLDPAELARDAEAQGQEAEVRRCAEHEPPRSGAEATDPRAPPASDAD
jgi:cyanophycin synthetase